MNTIDARQALSKLKKVLSRSLRPVAAKASLTVVATLTVALSGAQTILQCTERALPGEPINIWGDGFTGAVTVKMSPVNANGLTSTWTTTAVLTQSNGVLQVKVPSNYANGIWGVQVLTSAGASNITYINMPEVFFTDSTSGAAGTNINIYGRNLEVLGTADVGSVQFVPTSGVTLNAVVVKATPFDYTVTVPSGVVAGTTYTLKFNNGFGGTTGTVVAGTMSIIPNNPDPFNLGTWWGKQFTFSHNIYNIQTDTRLSLHANGLGKTEDMAAIQGAINAANKAGGGVVYLPAGTYRIGGTSPLLMLSNVVLEGAGPGLTILQYGYNWTTTACPAGTWAIDITDRTLAGIYGLELQNLNPNVVENNAILLGVGNRPSDRVFVSDCWLLAANGNGLSAFLSSNILVANNKMSSTSIHSSPINMGGCLHSSFINNSVGYRAGRLNFYFMEDSVVSYNVFSRDNSFMVPGYTETGGIETTCSKNFVCMNNTVQGLGMFPTIINCGEQINAQKANTPDEEDLGTVTSATASTLNNIKKSWPTSRAFTTPNKGLFNRAVVGIVNGKGAGQYRTITANTSSTLAIAPNWTVIPDSSSVYAIFFWPADHQLILKNNISNSSMGILLNDGGIDNVIDSNTVTNAYQIQVRTEDWSADKEEVPSVFSGRRHDVSWGNWVSNNSVINTSGNRPAGVSAYTVNVDGVSYGNDSMGLEIRSNKVVAHVPNTYFQLEGGFTEGYFNFVDNYYTTNTFPYSHMGTLMLYNTQQNTSNAVTSTGSGMMQLVAQTTVAP